MRVKTARDTQGGPDQPPRAGKQQPIQVGEKTGRNDPCPCGRTYPRLPKGIYGRADDMFVIRGENVYPSAIENVIRGVGGLGDEFRIVINRDKTMDEMIVQAERSPQADPAIMPELKERTNA